MYIFTQEVLTSKTILQASVFCIYILYTYTMSLIVYSKLRNYTTYSNSEQSHLLCTINDDIRCRERGKEKKRIGKAALGGEISRRPANFLVPIITKNEESYVQ